MALEDLDGYGILPVEIVTQIKSLLGHIFQIMEARWNKNEADYTTALEKLRPEFRNQWHTLARCGMQYLMMLFDTSLRRRDIPRISRNQFEQLFESDILFWKRNKPQDYPKFIVYQLDETDQLNPGKYTELFFEFINPSCYYLFQRAKTNSDQFNIHDFESNELFEAEFVGHAEEDRMLKTLLKAIGRTETYYNHAVCNTGGQWDAGVDVIGLGQSEESFIEWNLYTVAVMQGRLINLEEDKVDDYTQFFL